MVPTLGALCLIMHFTTVVDIIDWSECNLILVWGSHNSVGHTFHGKCTKLEIWVLVLVYDVCHGHIVTE